jgi:hypothetical protein
VDARDERGHDERSPDRVQRNPGYAFEQSWKTRNPCESFPKDSDRFSVLAASSVDAVLLQCFTATMSPLQRLTMSHSAHAGARI